MERQKTAPVALRTTAVFSCSREVCGGTTPARMLGAAFSCSRNHILRVPIVPDAAQPFRAPGLRPTYLETLPSGARPPELRASNLACPLLPLAWGTPDGKSRTARGKRFPATHGNPAHGAASVRPAGTPCLTHKKAPQAPASLAHEGDFPASGPELPARRRGAGIRRSIRPQAAFQLSPPLGASARQARHVRGA